MILKPLTQQNLKEVSVLYTEVFTQEPWNDVYDHPDEVYNFIKLFLNDGSYLNYIAYVNDEVIGLCLGFKKPWIKGLEYYIDSFCIKTSYQNKSYGSQFLSLIDKDIKELGLNGYILNTERGFKSESFYLKNRFKKEEDLVILVK